MMERYALIIPTPVYSPEYNAYAEQLYTVLFETPEKAMEYLHEYIYDVDNEYPLRYETWKEWADEQNIYLYERCIA